MKTIESHLFLRPLKAVSDTVVTLLLWTYFTLGFIVLFSPFYLLAYLFSKDREISYQRLNHFFYRGFFWLARILIPLHQWHIDRHIPEIRSSMIVCNHLSYLDPLILISLFEKHKTIVKNRLFKIPVFGRMLILSGYIPSISQGKLSELMFHRIETMGDYLAKGGNLFIFPEGTRSKDAGIGSFNKGTFKIARLCKAPIKVLFIRNTNRLFRPGRFLFNTSVSNTITVELVDSIEPDYQSQHFSVSRLTKHVQSLLEARAKIAVHVP